MDNFLSLADSKDFFLALNIKSDGLVTHLADYLAKFDTKESFVFYTSVPDQLTFYRNRRIQLSYPIFSCASEYEPVILLYEACHGVWLDAFESTWYDVAYIKNILELGKKVYIVSSELHKREDYLTLWAMLKNSGLTQSKKLILFTDISEKAQQYFEGENDKSYYFLYRRCADRIRRLVL